MDQVSLLPGNAVTVRARRVGEGEGAQTGVHRWPGGNVAQDYHWQWGMVRATTPDVDQPVLEERARAGRLRHRRFIQFARDVGAEPSITVNVEGRGATAAEAAAWVEYCNGPATSTYGAMRASNGHPEPYGVKYWEIGNEIWGDWVRGHSDAATYARTSPATSRRCAPSIPHPGDRRRRQRHGVEPHGAAAGGRELTIWRFTTTTATATWTPTSQPDGPPAALRAFVRRDGGGAARPGPGRRPRLAINEWGLDVPESQQYSILAALYGARLMNVFERRGDLVAMSAVSDLVNGWPGGLIQASRHGVFVTPIYLVNSLYAAHLGATRLDAKVDGATFSSTREGSQIPVLDVSASRSADGRRIFIKAVNTDLERPLRLGSRYAARTFPRMPW